MIVAMIGGNDIDGRVAMVAVFCARETTKQGHEGVNVPPIPSSAEAGKSGKRLGNSSSRPFLHS